MVKLCEFFPRSLTDWPAHAHTCQQAHGGAHVVSDFFILPVQVHTFDNATF